MASTVVSTSLNGRATAQTGVTIDFLTAKANVAMVLVSTGTIDGGLVVMESSQDGTNWVQHRVIEPVSGYNQGCESVGGAYRFWRASILRGISGGGSVTATFMEAD